MNIQFRFLVAPILFFIAACETVSWQNPDVPQEQWKTDRTACVRSARNASEPARKRVAKLERLRRSGDENESYNRQVDRAETEADRAEARYYKDCLRGKGYSLLPGI